MKLFIRKNFRDKNTGERYLEGQTVVFDDDRAEELLSDSRKLVSKSPPKKKRS